MTKLEYSITNVVASTKIIGGVDLSTIFHSLENVEYDPSSFAGLVYRRKDPKSTIIIFSSGKITSVGTNSRINAVSAIEKTLVEIEKIAQKSMKLEPIKIVNLVINYDAGIPLDLERIAMETPNSQYEPEQFPAARVKPKDKHWTALLFGTGKIIITGLKSETDASAAIRCIRSLIKG